METIIIATLSILFIIGCLGTLGVIIFAMWPDLWYEFKSMVYARWLRFKEFFTHEPLISGDIISLENMIERANPASLSDKEHILTMMSEVWNEGFNSQEEMIRYDACKEAFLTKFGR